MKAIMMSIRPQHVANILNGLKTIEIRKKFPKDYVGWVYIYVTKDTSNGFLYKVRGYGYDLVDELDLIPPLNGKVVARFWVDKVGWFSKEIFGTYEEPFTYNQDDLLKKSCLTEKELDIYLQGKNGYAIHITKLEIFDKPKEINEFRKYCDKHFNWWTIRCLDCKAYTPDTDIEDYCNENKLALTKAPQSYCFVEV